MIGEALVELGSTRIIYQHSIWWISSLEMVNSLGTIEWWVKNELLNN